MSGESAYRQAGVDYEVLDAAKRAALAQALATSPLLERRGGRALDELHDGEAHCAEQEVADRSARATCASRP